MSVVNRMLQDIDRRMGADAVHPAHPDVRSVPAPAARPRTHAPLAIAIAAAVVALGIYWGTRPQPPASAPQPMPKPVLAAANVEPRPASLPPPASEPAPAAPPAVVVAARAETPPETVAPRETPAPRRAEAKPAPQTFRLARDLLTQPAAPPVARSEPAPMKPADVRRAEVPVRRIAADETVAAALALWNEGSREDALATLRQALATAEPRNPPATRRLARELARLEVAGDRPDAALALLRRMEAALAEDADAWALRGNAAQRLSLHPEAASSYLAAVRLRPEEGKWMLGAAISLAADGKLAEARPWVERARERGALTPAISAYLRQLGLAPQ